MLQDKDMAKYGMEKWESGTGQNVWVHSLENCKGEHCPIHNPSDHHMKDWPTNWRGDWGIMERICKCGVGHPDPDDMHIVNGNIDGTHGCCGCCFDASLQTAIAILKVPQPERDTVEEILDANMMNGNPEMVFDKKPK